MFRQNVGIKVLKCKRTNLGPISFLMRRLKI